MEAYSLIVLRSDMYYYPVLCIILNACFTRAKYAVFKLFSCVHTVIMNVLKQNEMSTNKVLASKINN